MLFIDQMKRTIRLEQTPKRIVSLVPSQTELLYDLGLINELVGITKFCIHPQICFESKTRIGGTKNIDFQKINNLKPDLIIGNKEENAIEDIQRLEKEYPVWMSDISNLDDALEAIHAIAELTSTTEKGRNIVSQIKNQFASLPSFASPKKVLYFIWKNPFMLAGKSTFIDDMLQRMGCVNCIESGRYPEMQEDELQQLSPDFVFLSSEPYPFGTKHIESFQQLFPQAKIVLVDGEYFSWYGSRMLKAPAYFAELLAQLQ